jgi:predicted dehydrogenase
LWFDNAQALAASPEIDLVVVSVRMPSHCDIVIAALEAGKLSCANGHSVETRRKAKS